MEETIGLFIGLFVVAFYFLFIILWIAFYASIIAIVVGGTVLWVFMLVDCVQRNFTKENEKITWILVLALTHWVGGLIYYFVVYKPAKKKLKPTVDSQKSS